MPDQLQAVHPRHTNIGNNQIYRPAAGHDHRLAAVVRRPDDFDPISKLRMPLRISCSSSTIRIRMFKLPLVMRADRKAKADDRPDFLMAFDMELGRERNGLLLLSEDRRLEGAFFTFAPSVCRI